MNGSSQTFRWTILAGALCLGAAFVTLNATGQTQENPPAAQAPANPPPNPPSGTSPPASPTASAPSASDSPTPASNKKPADTSTAAKPAASAKEPSPKKPGRATVKDSATIHNDPTVAPDAGDSADSSVIFPADI